MKNIPRTPLQKYELEEYFLTGIISGIDRPRALFQDPQGQGHVAELGCYIGKHNGRVTEIEEGFIIVVEEIKTSNGIEEKRHKLSLFTSE